MHKKIDSNIGMSFFGVAFQAGGYWEKEGQRGTSHLMEHLMCKTYEYLYPKMRELGVSDNALTSNNRVAFFCSGLDECVAQISQTILDSITKQENLWSKEQFENEKNVVLQEYNDAFNNQEEGTFLNAIRKYYNYCCSIGFRKDIEDFTYEDSLAAAKEIFSTPSMIVEVGYHGVKYNGDFRNLHDENNLKFGECSLEQEIVPKTDQSVVCLIGNNISNISIASKINLLTTCIASGLESPLYQELREKRGIVYSVWMFDQVIGNGIIPLSGAQTSVKNKDELILAYKEIFSKDMKDVISRERFDACKRGMLYEKKEATILPYMSVWTTHMRDYNPYENIEDFTYDQAIELANKTLSIDNFQLISY